MTWQPIETAPKGGTNKSRWQKEFDALPEWAQKLVIGLQGVRAHGSFNASLIFGKGMFDDASAQHVILERESSKGFSDGLWGAMDLAEALTAPYPPPEPPARERHALNIVEFMADGEDEDDAPRFDHPCCFGSRVPGHAVYCHNDAWPHSPRKCHRRADNPEHLPEDCPGFVANPDAVYTEEGEQ